MCEDPSGRQHAQAASWENGQLGWEGLTSLGGWCHNASLVTAVCCDRHPSLHILSAERAHMGHVTSDEARPLHRCIHSALGDIPIKAVSHFKFSSTE